MIKIIIFTCILALLIFIADQFLIPNLIHSQIWVLLAFFFVLSLIGHRITQIGIQRNKDNAVLYYFSVMLLRLVISGVFIAVYLYTGTTDRIVLIGNFFILYLLYVAFEIKTLLTNLQRNSKQQERHEPQNLS